MPPSSIQERVEQHIARVRRRHWYTRWWGILTVIAVLVALFFVTIFVFETVFYAQQIKSGALTYRAADLVQQGMTLKLLQEQDDPSIGPTTAKVTIVAFEDFQCPFCLKAQPFLKQLLVEHAGEVRFIWKDMPLSSIHDQAQSAAEAGQCAYEQGKFWEFHDQLFEHQDILGDDLYRSIAKSVGLNLSQFNVCYNTGKYRTKIAGNSLLGEQLGVVGTPTFFMNGQTVPILQGYTSSVTDQAIEQLIEVLKKL
jgi:protein-disulfide isomerase